jgi:hypothetical protein
MPRMTESEYTQATALRMRLENLGTERGDLIEARHELVERIGKALLAVHGMARVSMADAADLLGVSRPAAYRMLEDARRRK